MLGLAYALETCIHASENPLNIVAQSSRGSELAQISDMLVGNKVDVEDGCPLGEVVAAWLTPEHTSVDLVGHGRGDQIRIGDWGRTDGYREMGVAMAAKKTSMLRLLACEQAFHRTTRAALGQIQKAHFAQFGVAMSVAGGKVVADQFDSKKRRYDNRGSCRNLVFPDLLRQLFSGTCPVLAFSQGPVMAAPSGWGILPESRALDMCLSRPGVVISVDSEDARRILSNPTRRPDRTVLMGEPMFSMCLPCDGGVLAGVAHTVSENCYVLVPRHLGDAGVSESFLLNCGVAAALINRETAALYWR